jgi:hypothetical protein
VKCSFFLRSFKLVHAPTAPTIEFRQVTFVLPEEPWYCRGYNRNRPFLPANRNCHKNFNNPCNSYLIRPFCFILLKRWTSPLTYGYICNFINVLYSVNPVSAGHSGHAVWGRLVAGMWFESRSRHGCLTASFCVVLSCVGRGLATGWLLVQGVLPYV